MVPLIMKNIVIISQYYSPKICGVGDYSNNLAEVLSRNNKVFVVTKEDISGKTDYEDSQNFQVFREIHKWNFLSGLVAFKKIRKLKPDVVLLQYTNGFKDGFGLPFGIMFVVTLLSIYRIKLITTFHEIGVRTEDNFIKGVLERIIALFIGLVSNKIVTSISEYARFFKFFNYKTSIISIPSNIHDFDISNLDIENFKILNNSVGKITLCTFGFRLKGLASLLNAVRKLKQSNVNVILFLIGGFSKENDRKIKDWLTDYDIIDNVIITGYLGQFDVIKYIKSSDYFVLIEQDYGISLKSGSLATAFMAGIPIISNKGKYTSPELMDRENILFFNTIELQSIENAVQYLINNSELSKKLKKNSKTFYKTNLSWDVVLNKYNLILSNLQ